MRYFNNYHGEDNSDVRMIREILSSNDWEYHHRGFGTSRLQGIEYQNGWELGKHKLIVGAEWHKANATNFAFMPQLSMFSSIIPNIPTINLPISEPKEMRNTSIYLQDTISFDDKWTFVPGIRYDHNNNFGHQWSPKAAINYRADDKTKIYASWGKIFRAPSIAEVYSAGIFTDTSFAILGGKYSEMVFGDKFRPEKGHSEIIGVEHDFN